MITLSFNLSFLITAGIVFGDYDEQWKLQRHTSMMILRNLGYGRNRLQEIITEETEELCKLISNKEGKVFDICDMIKYVCVTGFHLII